MINKVFLNQITIELCQTYVLGGAKRMKIHRSAKICQHTKGGYLAQQLIHKTKSGYTDPGHYKSYECTLKHHFFYSTPSNQQPFFSSIRPGAWGSKGGVATDQCQLNSSNLNLLL